MPTASQVAFSLKLHLSSESNLIKVALAVPSQQRGLHQFAFSSFRISQSTDKIELKATSVISGPGLSQSLSQSLLMVSKTDFY